MTVEIYSALKTRLLALLGGDGKPLFKTVALWNNQIDHETQTDNDQYAYRKPACFIEFNNINCTNLGNKAKVQQCDFDTTLHLVHEFLKNEDTDILLSRQAVYQMMQITELSSIEPTSGRFTRIAEQPNYDNNLLIIYQQTYHSTYKDFSAVPTPNTGTVNTLTVNPIITTTP